MPWYQKTITSGPLVEIRHYYATRDGRSISRGPNVEASSEAQVEANQRSAEMDLCRLIACNFGGDMGGASYTFKCKAYMDESAASKRERNLLDRIKRARKRKGLPGLRYIATLEKQAWWHHHIVMDDDLTLDELTEIWQGVTGDPKAYVHVRTIATDAEGYMEVARYLLGEHKESRDPKRAGEVVKPDRRKWQRRWHASKGLSRPVVEKKPVKRTGAWGKVTAPKGLQLLDFRQWVDALGNVCTSLLGVRHAENAPKRSGGADVGKRRRKP